MQKTRANWPFPVVNGVVLPKLPRLPKYSPNAEDARW